MTRKMRIAFCCGAVVMLAACSGKSTADDSAALPSSDDGGAAGTDDGGDGESDGDGEDGADDGGEGGADDSGEDGAEECEVALDCAYACDPDEACALACGETWLDSDRRAAFEALVTCMAEAGCGFNEACLDASCEAEFVVFDELCT